MARTPKTSGKEFKRRSKAAKKAWKTRRSKAKVISRLDILEAAKRATDAAIKSRDSAKLALHMALNQHFGDKKLKRKLVAVFKENLKLAERAYQAIQSEERKIAFQDRKEQKRLAKVDPEAFIEGIRARIKEQTKDDSKGIPDLIAQLYVEVLEYDMGDYYDESDLWDIYQEAG